MGTFKGTRIDELNSNVIHTYEYRGYTYEVHENSEMPTDMQIQFEEQAIDHIIEEEENARKHICSL